MTYPSGDESMNDDPMANADSPFQDSTPLISRQLSSREKMADARRRTELFVRENPIPIVVGALVFGVAIGWALRHATAEDEEPETPLGRLNWNYLSLPFLWPFLKSMKEKAEDSAGNIKDVARDGMDRVRNIDIHRYSKPIRKRWRSWTN